MKYSFLIACLLFFGNALNAQYTWCVSIQGNIKLRHAGEDKERNVIYLTQEELNKGGFFHINFNRSNSAMRRTIFVDDAAGSGMKNWEEVKRRWQLPTVELRKLIEKGGGLSFYYSEIPRDINKAMVVKVRLVHLCTVKRKQ